ncbi:MAG: YdcF family protein [Clostridia bacterium]|nr:YdcF family protein [Clostridia bacterium]
MRPRKRVFLLLLALALLGLPMVARAEGEEPANYAVLFTDMARAAEAPSPEGRWRIEADAAAMNDPVATAVAARWIKIYADPDYRLMMYGQDDPRDIPVAGKHAFVVLGFELEKGEMTDELKGRCDAAAAAAKAFPDSLIVCTGGPTGIDNPEGHTEGGLMKAYLETVHGIDPNRVFAEEQAMSTAENAINVMAILQAQQVETLTVVTSHYHQRRGQILLAAAAARCKAEQGFDVEVVGDWSYLSAFDMGPDYMVTIPQLFQVLDIPEDVRDQYYELYYGD